MTTLRLDALIRVSQRAGRRDEDLRSPDQQREIIEREAASRGADVHWHPVAIDVSGKTMQRDDIAAVLRRIQAGQTDGLIVAYTSRFSRARVDEALRIKAAVEEAGGRLVVCDIGGIDIDTAAGELVFTNMLAMARFQWREMAERFEMSRRNAIRAGKSIGRAPFGYRVGEGGRLVVEEGEARIVRELFDRKVAGATWLELARWLDTQAPPPRGRHWSRSTVASMIARRTYLGEVRSGSFVNADAHPAIIPTTLWRRAQHEPGRRTPRGRYVLSGLVRCSGCGWRMQSSSGGKRTVPVYKCTTPGCELRYLTIKVDRLDEEVARQLMDVQVRLPDSQPETDGDLQAARDEVRRLSDELAAIAQVVPRHPTAVAAHQIALEEAEDTLREAERVLDDAEAAALSPTERSRAALRSYLHASPEERARRAEVDEPVVFEDDSLTLEELRGHLRATVDCVLVRRATGQGPASSIPDRILLLRRGEAPAELLQGSRRSQVTHWEWDSTRSTLRLGTT